MDYPTAESVVALAKKTFGASAALALKTPHENAWSWELNVGPTGDRKNLVTCARLDQIESFILTGK